MAEYIFEINEALYDEETGETVLKPEVKGELIRCRNCKQWFAGKTIDHDKHGAECVIMKRRMMPNDFCSYARRAERRED